MYYKESSRKNKTIVLVITIIFLVVSVVAAILTYFFVFKNSSKQLFNQIPIDKYAVQEEDSVAKTSSGMAKYSFEFSDTVIFENKKSTFRIKNPGSSAKALVVKVQISDEELISVNGSTGRSSAEQSELESNPDYKANVSRVTISQTDLIQSGYVVTDLELLTLDDGTYLKSGIYSGVAFLEFLDEESQEKSFVSNQVALRIEIK